MKKGTSRPGNVVIIGMIAVFCLSFLHDVPISASDMPIRFDIKVEKNGAITSIQDAIDTAQDFDVILIMNGTYSENLVIDKPLHLIGKDRTTTIIDGKNIGNVIKVNVENVTIQQLTIQHSGMVFPNAGINLSSRKATIKQNIIKSNYYGMTMYDAHDSVIEKNLIQDNDHCGIYMSQSTNNSIFGNYVSNHTYNGFGIYDSSHNNIVEDNTLMKNQYCGINLRLSSDNIIMGNTIAENNIGIHVPALDNTIKNNIFSDNEKRIDEELMVPGFETLLILLSLIILFGHYQRK